MENKEKMKNNNEKRKISVLTVFIWIFLVITMTTIVVSNIGNNNALEGENINNNSNKIETSGYYFIQREVFKGNNCLVKDISDLPADYNISCTIDSNIINKRLEEASYGIDENGNFYLEWAIELPSEGKYSCEWQTSGINMEGYDISTSHAMISPDGIIVNLEYNKLGYSINRMTVKNSSIYNNYLNYSDLGEEVRYEIRHCYYTLKNNKKERVGYTVRMPYGYRGDEINLEELLIKSYQGIEYEFDSFENNNKIVTLDRANQIFNINYVLKFITVTWIYEDGTEIKETVFPKDVTEDEIFKEYPDLPSNEGYWREWKIDKDGNIEIVWEYSSKYILKYKWEGLPEGNYIEIPVDTNSYNKGEKVKIDTNYMKGTVVKVNDIEYEFSGWGSEDIEISDDYEITIPEKM